MLADTRMRGIEDIMRDTGPRFRMRTAESSEKPGHGPAWWWPSRPPWPSPAWPAGSWTPPPRGCGKSTRTCH